MPKFENVHKSILARLAQRGPLSSPTIPNSLRSMRQLLRKAPRRRLDKTLDSSSGIRQNRRGVQPELPIGD
jgi:hypothetical protein